MFKNINRNILKYILASLLVILIITLIYFYTPTCTINYDNLEKIASIIKDIILAITPVITLYYTNKNQADINAHNEKIKTIEWENNFNDNLSKENAKLINDYTNSVSKLLFDYNNDNLISYKSNYYFFLAHINDNDISRIINDIDDELDSKGLLDKEKYDETKEYIQDMLKTLFRKYNLLVINKSTKN